MEVQSQEEKEELVLEQPQARTTIIIIIKAD